VRHLLVSLVFLAALPLGGMPASAIARSGGSHDLRIAAPTATAGVSAISATRSGVSLRESVSASGALPARTAPVAGARRVAAAPVLRHDVARWLQGHVTSTAIP